MKTRSIGLILLSISIVMLFISGFLSNSEIAENLQKVGIVSLLIGVVTSLIGQLIAKDKRDDQTETKRNQKNINPPQPSVYKTLLELSIIKSNFDFLKKSRCTIKLMASAISAKEATKLIEAEIQKYTPPQDGRNRELRISEVYKLESFEICDCARSRCGTVYWDWERDGNVQNEESVTTTRTHWWVFRKGTDEFWVYESKASNTHRT